MNLYVYYDVGGLDFALLAGRVRAMQATLGLESHTPKLLRRAEGEAASQTWMEIYEGVAADFEGRLAAGVEAHGIAALTGPRHVERFVDLD